MVHVGACCAAIVAKALNGTSVVARLHAVCAHHLLCRCWPCCACCLAEHGPALAAAPWRAGGCNQCNQCNPCAVAACACWHAVWHQQPAAAGDDHGWCCHRACSTLKRYSSQNPAYCGVACHTRQRVLRHTVSPHVFFVCPLTTFIHQHTGGVWRSAGRRVVCGGRGTRPMDAPPWVAEPADCWARHHAGGTAAAKVRARVMPMPMHQCTCCMLS